MNNSNPHAISLKANAFKLAIALLHFGDAILRFVGMVTITVFNHLVMALLVTHQTLTSVTAFKRYGRWIRAAYRFCDRNGRLFSEWLVHVAYYRGSLGYVHLDVADHERDGYVVLREFGDQRMVALNFYCENRWQIRKGPNGRVLSELRTQVMDAGHNIAHIVWGDKKMMPYHAPALKLNRYPDDKGVPAEVTWTPAVEFPDYRRFAANDILTRVS